jgi:23S rRNA (cytidine1920-2'-O)/16S rRNA (cytidine1409-2'-O)-methyltransferase
MLPAMSSPNSVQRLDQALLARSLAPSRERAQAMIAAGLVEVDGRRASSAAQRVGETAALRVLGKDHPWASRGGLKLVAALDVFGVDCAGRVCLDAGASNGGFTDVLLSRGAASVYAVDVGHGQLDGRLASSPDVVVMDRTNLRTLRALPGPPPDLVTLDLSFISLRLVLPAVALLVAADRPADVIALYKPQFELGRDAVGRGGVVRDDARGETGAMEFLDWVSGALGAAKNQSALRADVWHPPLRAPVRGAKGNQEWLLHFKLSAAAGEDA